jgi:hypothetical protein
LLFWPVHRCWLLRAYFPALCKGEREQLRLQSLVEPSSSLGDPTATLSQGSRHAAPLYKPENDHASIIQPVESTECGCGRCRQSGISTLPPTSRLSSLYGVFPCAVLQIYSCDVRLGSSSTVCVRPSNVRCTPYRVQNCGHRPGLMGRSWRDCRGRFNQRVACG